MDSNGTVKKDPRYIDWSKVGPQFLAPLPEKLLEYFLRRDGEGEAEAADGPGEPIFEGRRDSTLTSMGGAMRRRGFGEESIAAALLVENEQRCEPPLDDDQVRKIARSLARYDPDPGAGVDLRPAPERPGLVRVPASQLRRLKDAQRWFWKGLVPAEMVTIFSALPKAGKTTLLAHLLRAAEAGDDLCGLSVAPARVVYVTEESESLWAERRDRLGLEDHCEFILRPFRTKPTVLLWLDFLKQLTDSLAVAPAQLVVIDTLSKLWPVRNENDASEVTEALLPLLEIAYGLRSTLLLVHHLRKSEGLESTATRGSGGITAAVDSIIELRRYSAKDRKDRRRVLSCDARFDDRTDEIVVELAEDGIAYAAHGDRHQTVRGDLVTVLKTVLPGSSPGWTREEIEKAWPADECPRTRSLLEALNHGAEMGLWQREGDGKKGSPYTFWGPQ